MTQKDLNNWIMYHEIHKLSRLGFNASKIARHLVLDRRTVKKLLLMSDQEYEVHLSSAQQRAKTLAPYEYFVKAKLEEFTDTSTAQMHDWLKEHHPGFPKVSGRTVYNFVIYVRQKYNIPFEHQSREYFAVEELPYGQQAQVDFGQYNLRQASGNRKKVWFFAMVLSRSRMKFVCFTDKPFTAETVCHWHEQAFAFFGGIPRDIVYDQDRTMLVDENMGDLILTATFKQYTKSRRFHLHFCRKADPESKGKVENVIQYVKKNFLYNRVYHDLDTLNAEVLAWLGRTANHLTHNYTKKAPEVEFMIEKTLLTSYTPLTIETKQPKMYHVRKTNTIAYRSNFYSLPMGVYHGPGTLVKVKEVNGSIEISNAKDELICIHKLSELTGQTIINNNHKRDHSKSTEQISKELSNRFTSAEVAKQFLEQIQKAFPRYPRDHWQAIDKALTKSNATQQDADKALSYCIKNQLFNGYEFEQVLLVLIDQAGPAAGQKEIVLLDKNNLAKASEAPNKSDINDYENIINP